MSHSPLRFPRLLSHPRLLRRTARIRGTHPRSQICPQSRPPWMSLRAWVAIQTFVPTNVTRGSHFLLRFPDARGQKPETGSSVATDTQWPRGAVLSFLGRVSLWFPLKYKTKTNKTGLNGSLDFKLLVETVDFLSWAHKKQSFWQRDQQQRRKGAGVWDRGPESLQTVSGESVCLRVQFAEDW